MRVRLNGTISGTRNGHEWPSRGEVIDLPDDEAAQLCANKLAVPVPVDDVETAVAPEPEKRRPGRPRKTGS